MLQTRCWFLAVLGLVAIVAHAEELGISVLRPGGPARPVSSIGLKNVEFTVEIEGLMARLTITHAFENTTRDALEAVWTFPLDPDAAIDRFAMSERSSSSSSGGGLNEGTCMLLNGAEGIFKAITEHTGYFIGDGIAMSDSDCRRSRDPAYLEYLDNGLCRARIYPIEANETKTVVVSCLLPLALHRSADGSCRAVCRIPLGMARQYLSLGSKVKLSAHLRGLAQSAAIASTPTVEQSRDGADTVLSAALRFNELKVDQWEISIEGAAADAYHNDCAVQAHRPDRGVPGAFALMLAPHDLEADLRGAAVRVEMADGKVTEIACAAGRQIECGKSAMYFGTYSQAGIAKVTLNGLVNGEPWSKEWQIELPEKVDGNGAAAKLLATARSRELLARDLRSDAAMQAGRYRVLSKDTAFLILDNDKRYNKYHVARGSNVTSSYDLLASVGIGSSPEDELSLRVIARRPLLRAEHASK